MNTLKEVIKMAVVLLAIGIATAIIMAVLVSVATSIYTSQKTPYRGLEDATAPIIIEAVDATSGRLEAVQANTGLLQPFSADDDNRADKYLQPSDYNGSLYYNTTTGQVESFRAN